MLKGLPRHFTDNDFETLLTEAGLISYVTKRHIPREVIARRDDATAPLAVAFIQFSNFEDAQYASDVLWKRSVLDQTGNTLRLISTTNPFKRHSDGQGSYGPLDNSQDIETDAKSRKPIWQPKGASQSTDASNPEVKETRMALYNKQKQPSQPINEWWDDQPPTSTWESQDWDQSDWDNLSATDNVAQLQVFAAAAAASETQNMTPLVDLRDRPEFAEPESRFKCIQCYTPFIKWSACLHHMKTTCLPRGVDPRILDDDENIKMICERLVNPFLLGL